MAEKKKPNKRRAAIDAAIDKADNKAPPKKKPEAPKNPYPPGSARAKLWARREADKAKAEAEKKKKK